MSKPLKSSKRNWSERERIQQLLLRAKKPSKEFKLEEYLFHEQLEFVSDPAKYATACNSVRSGKTTSCAADLVDTALRSPGTTGLYITLARSSAKRIVWPELLKIIHQYQIKCRINISELAIEFENHSHIYCFGANTEVEIEKIRGLSNVALVYIDECQAFREYIKDLINDVLVKRLYDTNGRLRLIGTPGPVLSGYFYDCCHSDSWSHHRWTMHQNPWLLKKSGLTPAQLITQDCKMRGVPESHPSIQRECFGRWVYDPDSLILHYDLEKNDYEKLPPGNYTHIMGLDLGTDDADSISVLAFKDGDPNTYLVEEIITTKQTIDPLIEQIKDVMSRYSVAAMPTDTGGLGKKVAETIVTRTGIPLVAADKTQKMTNYRILDNHLRNGTFKAKRDSRFAQDCNILERDNDKSTPDRIVVKGHSDSVDSCLYAFKLSPAYAFEPPKPKLKPGTPEADQDFHEKLLEEHLAKLERERQMKDGEPTWQTDREGIAPWNKWD